MTLEHVAVLVNPAAGGGRGQAIGRQVADDLRHRGLQVRELMGGNADEAAQLAAEAVADGVDALIACGGDGLIHSALPALAGTTTALGVVPSGTGNDFARAIGIPRGSVPAAVEVIVTGAARTVDLGRVGDRWFGAVMASGFDSKVNDRGNRMRWPRGRMKYNLALLAELAAFHPIRFRLELDEQLIDLEAMLVAVGNGSSYGGGMRICPNASMSDGLLEVTVVSRMSRAKLVRLFPSVYRGRHVRYPEVLTYRARRVVVRADDVTAYGDGELIGSLPLTCQAVPDALVVLAPPV